MKKALDMNATVEMGEQESPQKTVLVAILGTAPAVLTEAVWALAKNEGVVPDRVVVMTTASGKKRFLDLVLNSGVWNKLRADLSSAGFDVDGKLVFNAESDRFLMTFIDEETGAFVEDLPTEKSNLQAANQMMGQIREYTEDRSWQVIGLMAGGRKTMTALFFSVMGLLARRGDRLCHVLVSEPYEKPQLVPPFFYPQLGVVHRLDQQEYASEAAEVNLFDVPFVFLGEWAEQKCRAVSRKMSYENVIQAIEESMDKTLAPELTIDLAVGDLIVNGIQLRLAETEFVWFCFLAQDKDPDTAEKSITDFAAYLDDQGEEAKDECKCTWLERFYSSELFLRPGLEEKEWKKKIKNDRYKVANRLKDKLLGVCAWFRGEKSKIRIPPFASVKICHEDQLHANVYARLFPKRPYPSHKKDRTSGVRKS